MSNLCNCAKCAQKKYLSASNDECFSEEGDKTEKKYGDMSAWPAVHAEIVFGHNSSVKREQLEIGFNNTRITKGG